MTSPLDDIGPYFFRDLARVFQLPDNASLDDIMGCVKNMLSLMAAVKRKTETWQKVTDCYNEFGEDAPKSCGQVMEIDDAAMSVLLREYNKYESDRARKGQTT